MSIKYVGADVHKDTTSFCVLDKNGKVIQESTVLTNRDAMLDFVGGLRGEVHLTFEEGTQAGWLYDLFRKRVKEVVVCDPRKNKLMHVGSKNDRVDSRGLADLLRAGALKPVFHDDWSVKHLKEVVRGYDSLARDITRVKNRIKAIYRGRGIPCAGRSIYNPKNRGEWLDVLKENGARERAEILFLQLEPLEKLRAEAEKKVVREVKKQPATKILLTVPGLGKLRVGLVIGTVVTPHRFQNKRQFWAYCGFLVVRRSTGNWKAKAGELVWTEKRSSPRGLNRNRNPQMKWVFKSAVYQSLRHEEIREYWKRLREENHLSPEIARVTVARKLATITLAIWKKGELYDPSRLTNSAD